MDERDWLAQRFESHRERLTAVAHRMLGSRAEADDAVQEALAAARPHRRRRHANIGGWLMSSRACRWICCAHARRGARKIWTATPSTPRPTTVIRNSGPCWPTRSDPRCWSSSTCWNRRNESRSCCTTCSPCRSTRSPGSWTAPPPPPGSWRAARAVVCMCASPGPRPSTAASTLSGRTPAVHGRVRFHHRRRCGRGHPAHRRS